MAERMTENTGNSTFLSDHGPAGSITFAPSCGQMVGKPRVARVFVHCDVSGQHAQWVAWICRPCNEQLTNT